MEEKFLTAQLFQEIFGFPRKRMQSGIDLKGAGEEHRALSPELREDRDSANDVCAEDEPAPDTLRAPLAGPTPAKAKQKRAQPKKSRRGFRA